MDADSRYLWRFPPRRLSAEEIRDSMLSVAGQSRPHGRRARFSTLPLLQDNVATYVPLDDFGPETYRRSGLPSECTSHTRRPDDRIRLSR